MPRLTRTSRSSPSPRKPSQTRLRVEGLEDRTTPAVFTVTDALDAGAGSLRQAVADSNALAGADEIRFDPALFTTSGVRTQDWVASGPGTTSITPASGPADTATFAYGTDSYYGSWGFSTVAAGTGTVTFDWEYDFSHGADYPSARLDFFDFTTGASVNLVNFFGSAGTGPQSFSGTGASLSVRAGDRYGLRVDGYTYDQGLQGSVTLTHVSAPGKATIPLTSGELAVTDDLTVTGPGANLVTVSGSNLSRVFNIDDGNTGTNRAVRIEGLTVADGRAAGDGGAIFSAESLQLDGVTVSGNTATGRGGGIATRFGSSLALTDSTVSGNTAGVTGGGVNSGFYAALTVAGSTISSNTAGNNGGGISFSGGATAVTDSTVSGNTSQNGFGGGVAGYYGSLSLTNATVTGNTTRFDGGGVSNQYGRLSVSGSTVSGNTAVNGRGGGLFSFGPLTVSDSTVSGNAALRVSGDTGQGGGIFSTSTATVTDTAVTGNRAAFGGGGIRNVGTMTLTGGTVTGNTATGDHPSGAYGGGISNIGTLIASATTVGGNTVSHPDPSRAFGGGLWAGGSTTLNGLTVSGNSAGVGGGIDASAFGPLALTNTTVSGNAASVSGGGIAAGSPASSFLSVTLTQVTVAANAAPAGGNLFLRSTALTLANTIVADAASGGDVNRDGSDTVTLRGGNLVEDGSVTGPHVLNADPHLLPLADYGGPTKTHYLAADSPAVDAGRGSAVPAELTTDQRGRDRVAGSRPDLGAVERPAPLVVTTTLDKVNHPDGAFIQGGVRAEKADNVDLPAVGTADWAVWGYTNGGRSTSLAPDVRKAGGSAISPLTDITNGNPLRGLGQFGPTGESTFDWWDGSPVPAATTAYTGIQHDGEGTTISNVGEGFEFTVPADAAAREVRLYFTVNFGTAKVTATLSGGGVAPVEQVFDGTNSFNRAGVFDLRYAGTAPGQTLTIRIVLVADNEPRFNSANVAVDAVALTELPPNSPGVSLREAVEAANALIGPDEITFAPSLHNKTITLTLGSLPITSDLAVTGLGAKKLTVSGNDSSQVFAVNDLDPATARTVRISDLTITGGRKTLGGGIFNAESLELDGVRLSGNAAVLRGGGVYNDRGAGLTLTDSTVSGNTSAQDGGGVFNSFGATLAATGVTVSGNTASRGGGIFNRGTATLAASTVSGNTAGHGRGGGVANYYGNMTLTNSTVSGNSADADGGGISNYGGTLAVTDSTVTGNSAGSDGGGIANDYSGRADVTRSTVSGNSARSGGGLDNDRRSTLAVTDSTVSGNHAGYDGGGINNISTLTVSGSTVSGNTADGDGGGVFFEHLRWFGDASVSLVNSTVSGNAAGESGGGLFLQGTPGDSYYYYGYLYTTPATYADVTVAQATVADNGAASGGNVAVREAGRLTLANSIVADARSGGDVSQSGGDEQIILSGVNLVEDGSVTDPSVINADPRLLPLANNGGPTKTHALRPGSPALNTGSNAAIPPGVATDQRGAGYDRVRGGTVDLGAFEVQTSRVKARHDSESTPEDTAVNVVVLANDTDEYGTPLRVAAAGRPAHGTVVLNPDGTITYTPAPDFNGRDEFTYTVTNPYGETDTATVRVTVKPVNDAPTLTVPGAQATAEDVAVTITGIAVADLDAAEGNGRVRVTLSVGSGKLSVACVAGGLTAGQITGNGTERVVLEGTPAAINATLAAGVMYLGRVNFAGTDTLRVVANDLGNTGPGGPLEAAGTLSIRVYSSAEQIALLEAQVLQFGDQGVLNGGQTNALDTKLDQAARKLAEGQVRAADNLVGAFINQVEALRAAGVLGAAQADLLLLPAGRLRQSLQVGGGF